MLPYIDIKATGRRIDNLRAERGLSKAEIQRYFGFSTPQAVYKWIYGKSLPSADNLVILADLFNCKIEDILVIIRGA